MSLLADFHHTQTLPYGDTCSCVGMPIRRLYTPVNICKSGIPHFSSYCTLVHEGQAFVLIQQLFQEQWSSKDVFDIFTFSVFKNISVGWPWSVTLPRRARS